MEKVWNLDQYKRPCNKKRLHGNSSFNDKSNEGQSVAVNKPVLNKLYKKSLDPLHNFHITRHYVGPSPTKQEFNFLPWDN